MMLFDSMVIFFYGLVTFLLFMIINCMLVIVGILGVVSILLSYVYGMVLYGLSFILFSDWVQFLSRFDYVICIPAYVIESVIAPVSVGNDNKIFVFNRHHGQNDKKGLIITFGGNNMRLKGSQDSLEASSDAIVQYFSKEYQRSFDHLLFDIKQAKDYATLLKIYQQMILDKNYLDHYDFILFHGMSLGGALALQLPLVLDEYLKDKQVHIRVENTFTTLADAAMANYYYVAYFYLKVFWPMDNTKTYSLLKNKHNVTLKVVSVKDDQVLKWSSFSPPGTQIIPGHHNTFLWMFEEAS